MIYANDEKKEYLETVEAFLMPLLDFESARYAKDELTQREYMRIADNLGGVSFHDITGMTKAEILKDVCKVVLIDQARLVPDSYIDDIRTKRKVAGLFRR